MSIMNSYSGMNVAVTAIEHHLNILIIQIMTVNKFLQSLDCTLNPLLIILLCQSCMHRSIHIVFSFVCQASVHCAIIYNICGYKF